MLGLSKVALLKEKKKSNLRQFYKKNIFIFNIIVYRQNFLSAAFWFSVMVVRVAKFEFGALFFLLN